MLSKIRPLLLIVLILGAGAAGRAQPARSAPPPDPALALIAGNRLILIDRAGTPWTRDLPIAAARPWARIELPPGGHPVTQLSCAPGGSGACVMLLGTGASARLGLLRADAGSVSDPEIPASALVRFLGPDTLYFLRRTPEGDSQLLAYTMSIGAVRPAGTVRRDELIDEVQINAVPVLLARSRTDGAGRTLDRQPAIRFPANFPAIDLVSARGMLFLEAWGRARPVLEGHRSLRSIEVRADSQGQVSSRAGVLVSLRTDGPLLDPHSLVLDGAGDIYATTTAAEGRAVVVACRDARGQMSFAPVRRIAPDENVRLIAAPSGVGLVALIGSSTASAQIHVLRLGGPGGGARAGRPCAGIVLQAANADLPVETLPAPWRTEMLAATLPDGTRLPFVLYNPSGAAVEHLIVDVYGAYGQLRRFTPPSSAERTRLARTGTALALVTVRGDGNGGFAFAMASRSPQRQRAVDDLIAVTQQLRARFPRAGRVTARGRSAGAWLAVAAALERPDLFAGAIGLSGAYLFSEDRLGAGEGRFFAADDSFERGRLARANCADLQFRLLHARDDAITSFDQAQRFAEMLNRQGCATELLAFDVGGHGLARTLAPPDGRRETDGYNLPILPRGD